jgi:PilZ domain
MTNVPTSAQDAAHLIPQSNERRQRDRLQIDVSIHVRPVCPNGDGLVEVTKTIDFNRKGVCFVGLLSHYYVGMVLFVTVPFAGPPVQNRVLGEVVRIEKLANGAQTVAVKFLDE